MSAATTPNDSPISAPIQPLHNPAQAAHVVVPKAPLGNVGNQPAGMGAKALLAKKMAKNPNPTFISPTDNLMTPCTQKLTAAKKKHFTKSVPSCSLLSLSADMCVQGCKSHPTLRTNRRARRRERRRVPAFGRSAAATRYGNEENPF
ncbi:hypothetical protein C8R47DRAFT_984863 [Mycena vitilis]|nr:hypothetical protein C8R47DRAFT_984863 [Mycena vitilis]